MLLELANDAEEVFDLDVVQRSRRLVHDQDLRLERQRFGDFDHLLLGDRQITDQSFRIELQVQPVEDGLRVDAHLLAIDNDPQVRSWFAPNEDVLRHRQVVHQVQLLVDDAYPQ